MTRKLMVMCAMALGALAVVAATTYTVSNTGEGDGTDSGVTLAMPGTHNTNDFFFNMGSLIVSNVTVSSSFSSFCNNNTNGTLGIVGCRFENCRLNPTFHIRLRFQLFSRHNSAVFRVPCQFVRIASEKSV